MLCPGCGCEVDDDVVFCPQCRFQFRETDENPIETDTAMPDTNGSMFEQSPDEFSTMYCPNCGYEVNDDVVFCPQCRFQFRQPADGKAPAGNIASGESGYKECVDGVIEESLKGFSDKELRQLKVQLLQPAILVVLIISLILYSVISTVPFIPLTIAGLTFRVTGIVCFACGLAGGMLFLVIAQRSLKKFRYR